MGVQERIQDAAETNALITGTAETVKHMDELDQVILAANTPAHLRQKINTAAEDHDVTIEEIDLDNKELGSLCMKPYAATVIGLLED